MKIKIWCFVFLNCERAVTKRKIGHPNLYYSDVYNWDLTALQKNPTGWLLTALNQTKWKQKKNHERKKVEHSRRLNKKFTTRGTVSIADLSHWFYFVVALL